MIAKNSVSQFPGKAPSKKAVMQDRLASATGALVRRFRRQRPLRGGSLIITIFGDAIAPRGGAVSLGSLIRLAEPFGLTERLVRTSVARLATEGWLVARRNGRLSEYRLTPGGAQRFAQATERIYAENPRTWDGRWTLLVLPPGTARERERIREELRWLGFGQIAPGLLAHAGMDLAQAKQRLRELDAPDDVLVLEASTSDVAADRKLVEKGWDLQELARRYRRFVDAFQPIASAAGTRRIAQPQTAFIVRTLLIHEYRKIHLRDPLLPPALLPPDWVGLQAYELCRELYGKVFAAAEEFLSATAATIEHPLPPADPTAYARFGGIPASCRD